MQDNTQTIKNIKALDRYIGKLKRKRSIVWTTWNRYMQQGLLNTQKGIDTRVELDGLDITIDDTNSKMMELSKTIKENNKGKE